MFLDSGTCFGFSEVFRILGRVFGFWEVFRILGRVFEFWEVFWILGSVFGFWEVFWILGSVSDSGTCFWNLGSVLSLRATVGDGSNYVSTPYGGGTFSLIRGRVGHFKTDLFRKLMFLLDGISLMFKPKNKKIRCYDMYESSF